MTRSRVSQRGLTASPLKVIVSTRFQVQEQEAKRENPTPPALKIITFQAAELPLQFSP
jgi:hypothetical protein